METTQQQRNGNGQGQGTRDRASGEAVQERSVEQGMSAEQEMVFKLKMAIDERGRTSYRLRVCLKNQMAQIWSAAAVDSRRDEGAYPQDT